ncbi:hypothetical protein WJX77_000001 [Trebouxia sp. C0004]
MAFRPLQRLSVISAVRQPGDTEDTAEERGQLANAKYIAARHWEALLGSRSLAAQVSRDRAELQSELRRSAQKILVLEKEVEAADMQRSYMQQVYKEQLHEQQGLVAELRIQNDSLMEDKAALTEEITVRGAPVTSQHISSLLEVESPPAELDTDAAASSQSFSSSPVSSIHSAFLSELQSPKTIVKALTAMDTTPESPKATPLVNRSQRPAKLTNKLIPQATMTSGLAPSAQTPGKAPPPTSAAGRHMSALLQRKPSLGSPSTCPRPRTSPPRVVVTGSRSASSIRSNRGSETSPGTPPALDLLSPARAVGNRPGAVCCFPMALPSDAVASAVGTQARSPTVSFQTFVSSPTVPSPPRTVNNPTGSLLGARASDVTPTAPCAEPRVSVHSVVPLLDRGLSLSLSLPEAQGPMSCVALVPLQLTPVQQPLQAHGPSARSVAASNGRTRTVPSSAVGSGKGYRRSSTSSSTADRPTWSASFSRGSARLAEDVTPASRQLTSVNLHRAAGSTQPSPSPVMAVAGSPVEPSSVQAIRRTGSNAAVARLMSTAKTGGSTRTSAQPCAVRPAAAQPNAGRAAVRGTSRAASAVSAPAAQRPAKSRVRARSSKAAGFTPAEQSVAKHSKATSGTSDVVQRGSGPAPVEPKQTGRNKARSANKGIAPTRTQPARRAKDPGYSWKL